MLQQNLSEHYHFDSADMVCNQFNWFVNLLKKEEENSKENYPWLDKNDERKYMTDREILDKYINLDNSCLTRKEKEEVRDFLYGYKDAFSLRNEIGMCPNIEVEIVSWARLHSLLDHSMPESYIATCHKVTLDKEMKRLCYLGILKEGFSAYSCPVMLISRKMTQDKRVVTDFRHLNLCIAKNNLAYPLLKDTFTLLGSSRCEVFQY